MGFFELLKKKRYPRISKRIGLDITFRFEKEGKFTTGILKNISLQGFGFAAAGDIQQGSEINVEIEINCKDCDMQYKVMSLKERAIVKWVTPNRTMKLVDYDAGCEFLAPDTISQKMLEIVLQVLNATATRST